METFNSFQDLMASTTVVDNMTPTGGAELAAALPPGRYRFMEMPQDRIGYRVAAIDVNDHRNVPTFVFEHFRNKAEAMQKLNETRNLPNCQWTGVDPSRLIHVDDYSPGAVLYLNL